MLDPTLKTPAPWWWPDARGWCAAAVFVLTLLVLAMIRENPGLLSNASFMQLVGSIAGAGGLGLVLAFHFGSSSGTAKANERADKIISDAAGKDAGSVIVTPPSTVTVTTDAAAEPEAGDKP